MLESRQFSHLESEWDTIFIGVFGFLIPVDLISSLTSTLVKISTAWMGGVLVEVMTLKFC